MTETITVTPFQQRVYDATSRIPRGKVTTYKLLACEIDCGSSQAVGQALRRNPFAPEVPCHRVVASDLTLGGFSGQRGGYQLRRKRKLLEKEKVEFDEEGLVARKCLFEFSKSGSRDESRT